MDQEDGRCPGARGPQGGGGGAGPAETTPRGGSAPGSRLPRAARLLPGSRAVEVRAGVCRGAGLSPRGFSAGLGSHTGHPEPASPARSGRELSHWLLSPRRHGSASPIRAAGFPAVPAGPSLPASHLGICTPSPFCTDCGTTPPGGCPENPALSWGPSGLELHSCGMGDIASPLAGLGRTLAISSPSPACWEVLRWLGPVDGPCIQDNRAGFTLKLMNFKLQSPSVVICISDLLFLFLKSPRPSCIRKLGSPKIWTTPGSNSHPSHSNYQSLRRTHSAAGPRIIASC